MTIWKNNAIFLEFSGTMPDKESFSRDRYKQVILDIFIKLVIVALVAVHDKYLANEFSWIGLLAKICGRETTSNKISYILEMSSEEESVFFFACAA